MRRALALLLILTACRSDAARLEELQSERARYNLRAYALEYRADSIRSFYIDNTGSYVLHTRDAKWLALSDSAQEVRNRILLIDRDIDRLLRP